MTWRGGLAWTLDESSALLKALFSLEMRGLGPGDQEVGRGHSQPLGLGRQLLSSIGRATVGGPWPWVSTRGARTE